MSGDITIGQLAGELAQRFGDDYNEALDTVIDIVYEAGLANVGHANDAARTASAAVVLSSEDADYVACEYDDTEDDDD